MYSQWKFGVVLGFGAVVALALCVQCVRTYLYTDTVLVPEQAEHEAARQAGALNAAARTASIADPLGLGPLMERAMESASDRVVSMRLLDRDGSVLVQRGGTSKRAKLPANWWERAEKHEKLGTQINTPEGKALVVMLPFRMARPLRLGEVVQPGSPKELASPTPPNQSSPLEYVAHRPDDRRSAYVLELTISLNAVANAFNGLRQNLVIGLIASLALLASVALIGIRAPHHFRGKYLEKELQLARRVQSDLQPKPDSVSAYVDFDACAIAADHVGGDFYDIFEIEPGKIAIVLGDVSGKGVPAALLVSVLHGAIRSATASAHEVSLERINRMLCERTACERFATLFWGVFDVATHRLQYVNAGHVAPMLVRQAHNHVERLVEGGPVLGLLPGAKYSAGTVQIEELDTLVLYSDGITEAMSPNEDEFGEARLERIIVANPDAAPVQICRGIMLGLTEFADARAPQDDRTLMVVRFRNSDASLHEWKGQALATAFA